VAFSSARWINEFPMITRRTTLAGLSGIAVHALTPTAWSQTFPTRTITIVVPYPAGGPVDVVARLVAQLATPDLKQSIVVENRGGGGGVIGTMAVARAESDGHTLVLTTNQTHATNQSLMKNCPYDAARDFAGVAGIADIPHVLVIGKEVPAANVKDLITLAGTQSGGLAYGSSGIGSASHLAAELFRIRTGASMTHVPFRGAAPLAQALVGGHVQMSFVTLPSVVAQIEAGDLRALAVASPQRAARLPQVPTLKELDIDGVEADAWIALFAPAHTPQDVLERLYRSVASTLQTDTGRAAIAGQGMTLNLRTPREMASWLPGEIEKWAEVIRRAGISPE